MITYPLIFKSKAAILPKPLESWEITSAAFKTQCAVPPEFGGPGGGFSPEDLFAQALTNCFLATFKVYAQASKLVYTQVSANSELFVDLGESGKPVMKKLILKVNIAGAVQAQRVRTLAEKAFASGFILNSVKTELDFELSVSET